MDHPILIVEDNKEMAEALSAHLGRWGYPCELAHTWDDGLTRLTNREYALIILDVMLGAENGIELCKAARKQGLATPILMLTSKSEEIDVILGLDAGADDYLTKPFKMGELEARLRALLRRGGQRSAAVNAAENMLTFSEVAIDLAKQVVTLRGEKVELTAREFEVLAVLASQPGIPFTRAKILEAIGEPAVQNYEYTINTIIWRLRTKLEYDVENPKYIKTVRGTGYRFAEVHEL